MVVEPGCEGAPSIFLVRVGGEGNGRKGAAALGRQRTNRESCRKRRPLTGSFARSRHSTSVKLHNVFHNRKTETDAPHPARRPVLGLMKWFEDVRKKIAFDTSTIVLDPKFRHGI